MIGNCPSGGLLVPLKILLVFMILNINLFGCLLSYKIQDPIQNPLKTVESLPLISVDFDHALLNTDSGSVYVFTL